MTHRKSWLFALAGIGAVLPGALAAQQVVNLPAADKAITGAPERVFAVGKEEGESWEVYSNVASVAFDKAGNLYVLDRDNSRVVVIGPSGRHVRDVGKRGEGPGEFVLPMGMTTLADDRLAVLDMGNQAISLFDAKGVYQSLVRPEPQFGPPQQDITGSPTGGILMSASQIAMGMGGPGGGPPEIRDSIPILRLTTEGEPKTSVVVSAPSPKPVLSTSGDANRREVRLTPPPTFSPRVNWTVLSDGRVAVSSGTGYEIVLAGQDGRVANVFRRPISARRVTDRDRDQAKTARREALESGGGGMRIQNENGRRSVSAGGTIPSQQIEQMLAQMTFAETVPVVRAIRADRDGRLWIQRDGGPGSTDYPIDIVSNTGNYLGTIRGIALPNAFGPDGRFAIIDADDLGVQRVTVYRVPRTLVGSGR